MSRLFTHGLSLIVVNGIEKEMLWWPNVIWYRHLPYQYTSAVPFHRDHQCIRHTLCICVLQLKCSINAYQYILSYFVFPQTRFYTFHCFSNDWALVIQWNQSTLGGQTSKSEDDPQDLLSSSVTPYLLEPPPQCQVWSAMRLTSPH